MPECCVEKHNIQLTLDTFNFGGERYLETGEVLSDEEVATLKTYDAIYLGAIGHTDVPPGVLEKEFWLKLRFELDQYINLLTSKTI